MYEIVVIGGGPAGVTAALRACELGAKVALVERDRMGGTCTNDGCVPTRALAKAARLVRDARQFEAYGIDGEVRGVDMERLLARTQEIVFRVHEKKQLLLHLREAEADVFAEVGPARFVDPHTIVLADGRRIEGQKFIICTGGYARRLAFPGSEYTLTHHDIWSLKRLPRSIVVVGAAATGCQLASVFADFGVRVWLLEVAPRILATEDEVISDTIHDAFRRQGIEVMTSMQGVERIERSGDGLRLSLRAGGGVETIEAEAVVMAVGWAGHVETLNLAAAAVETANSYIVVNDFLQSSAPHIYAAGDINGRMMLVQSAQYEARIAAENAVLEQQQSYQHQIVPHGGFTDPEYGSVGLTEAQAREHGAYVQATVPYADLDRAFIDHYTDGFCKLIVSTENRQILGAHVAGEQAVEVVQLVAAGMAAGMRVEQLAGMELAYPTYTSIVELAAHQLVRQLGIVAVRAEWRNVQHLQQRYAAWERRTL